VQCGVRPTCKMFKVYLASQYHMKEQTRQYAKDLHAARLECTSDWLLEPHEASSKLVSLHTDLKEQYAAQDLYDILRADAFVVFSVSETTEIVRGGMVFETGFAYAQRKPVIVCGPKQCIFHFLPDIRQVETWPEALAILKQMARMK
jgi:nucleoside 2-deoxyribosyltransferase